MNSMTGYGDSRISCPFGSLRVEISSVNHKYREVSVKLPPECGMLEWRVRKLIEKHVRRGKINVFVRWEEKRPGGKVHVDSRIAGDYLKALRKMAENLKLGSEVGIGFLASLPGVLTVWQVWDGQERIWTFLEKGCANACRSLVGMRKKEGMITCKALDKSLVIINKKLKSICGRTDAVKRKYKSLIQRRVREFGVAIDKAQLTREAAAMAQRLDIEEETARLSGHLQQFCAAIRKNEDVGRKLDFIIQEMNREVNTIGAKSEDLNISTKIIDIKAELQKMREQVQNVE